MTRKLFPKQRGQVSILLAVSMTTLLAVVGLSLSAGLSYMIRAKLNAATDAASLAAARATSIGGDQATQTANAKAAATRFFNANFPATFMGASATLNEPQISFNGGAVTIGVSASATMPTFFMGNLTSGPLAPAVLTETKRKDLDMVVALDVSGSLSGQAAQVRSSAITFLKQFNSQRDRVGLLHFAYGAVIDQDIRPIARGFDRTAMETAIGYYSFNGSTASAEGMYAARDMINRVPEANLNRSNLRVIVFFSDGAPNAFASYLNWNNVFECNQPGTITTDDDGSGEPGGLMKFDKQNEAVGGGCTPDQKNTSNLLSKKATLPVWYNGHNKADQEYKVVTNSPRQVTNAINYDNVNRAARNLVEAMAAKTRGENVFVFTLGLGTALKQITGTDTEIGEDILKCMANSTDAPSRCFNANQPIGVYCHAATQAELTPCFSKLASAILRISK
jgi:Flp pilus assembly protein TadG